MSLQACRVVLVRPRIAGNLGATARVMKNMGLCDLVLVNPEADPDDVQARRLSTHGETILHQARRTADLSEAIADCVMVAGTSARIGGPVRRQAVAAPDEVMPRLLEALPAGPVALVFGPEPSGLADTEVMQCHWLIHIPVDPTYPALNLAQAVAICLYELRRAWLEQAGPAIASAVAPVALQERMFTNLQIALQGIHFLYGPRSDALMHALRHLIGRAQPTAMEVNVLLGMARQIQWYIDHHGPPARD